MHKSSSMKESVREEMWRKKLKGDEMTEREVNAERENVFSMLLTAVFSSLLCSHGGKSFTCDVVVASSSAITRCESRTNNITS
jgi:hypothetical protein